MANYTYKLENGEYVFYKDNKVLKTPNDVVVKTTKEELAKTLLTNLEHKMGYSAPFSLLTYHYTYCNLEAQYDLNFIADVFGVSQADRESRILKYGNMFELTEKLSDPISSYSHGMQQKLAVMSALIHDPKLILMDEPFVGLDPMAAHLLKQTMREICDNGGAIFFSTHVLEVAEKLCDKVAIIKDGKLIRSGTMEEVKGDASLEDVFLELEAEKD